MLDCNLSGRQKYKQTNEENKKQMSRRHENNNAYTKLSKIRWLFIYSKLVWIYKLTPVLEMGIIDEKKDFDE